MAARSNGWDGVRLGLAFAGSLILHAFLLFPFGAAPARVAAFPEPPLEARLSAPALASRPEALSPELVEPPPETPAAVLPASTFAPPRPLDGRRLDHALAALAREEFYPREAIARGLEGTVTLLLTLDAGGRVTAVTVAGGSGHALLDEAAVRAARRIARVPGSRGQVLLPVEFRLE